jgi:hypothetical protein
MKIIALVSVLALAVPALAQAPPPTFVGVVDFVVVPTHNVDDPESPWHLVTSACIWNTKPTTANNYGSEGLGHGCNTVVLSRREALDLSAKLKAWAEEPYVSHNVYRKTVQ